MSEYLFTPLPWSEEPLTLSDDSVAELSTLEITFVRFDEQSVRYEYRSSLKKALARLNAIATTRMNSSMPNLLAVLWLSAMQESEDSKGVSVSDCPFVTRSGDAALAIDAFNYMRRIDKIMAVPLSKPINQQWFFDTHAIFTSDKQGIQNDCYRTDPLWIDNSPISERACWGANPSDIPALMQDLVDFLSTPKMTPTVQAALAHFQLHAIQPFSVATDHVERSLSMTLVKKAGIADHIFPCFNLAAASHPDAYARALAPYLYDSNGDMETWIESWLRYCACEMNYALQTAKAYMANIHSIIEGWKRLIQPVQHGSTIDVLLRELPGQPMINTSIGMALTGKSFTTVREAILSLEAAGIIQRAGSTNRSKLYVAGQVIDVEQALLDKLDQSRPQA